MYLLMRLWMPLQIQVLQLLFFQWKLLFNITYLAFDSAGGFDSTDERAHDSDLASLDAEGSGESGPLCFGYKSLTLSSFK